MNDPFQAVIRQQNLSDQVAEQMQELIVSGQLQPGERLPSERELADRFGVSRTVIREAVRSLTAKGLIEVQSGSGMVISIPKVSSIAEHLGLLLRLNSEGDPLEYIFDVRFVLEVEIAGRAARQATPENIHDLETILENMAAQMKNVEEAARLDVEFHATLAKATQNPLFSILLDSVAEIMLEVRRMGMLLDHERSVLRQHHRILDRVKAEDVEGARQAMSDHLQTGQELTRQVIHLRNAENSSD
jgi:GntR family transcriptional repressor for pyruvate dehydrogenase complex